MLSFKLPAKHGFILMRIIQEDDAWKKVADVEVHNKRVEDHPGSIRRQVVAMNAVCRFLDAYGHQKWKDFELRAVRSSSRIAPVCRSRHDQVTRSDDGAR